jgi:hypothetical protein
MITVERACETPGRRTGIGQEGREVHLLSLLLRCYMTNVGSHDQLHAPELARPSCGD